MNLSREFEPPGRRMLPVPATRSELLDEQELAVPGGSAEKRLQTLRRVHSVASNATSSLSLNGHALPVKAAENDEIPAEKAGRGLDIPVRTFARRPKPYAHGASKPSLRETIEPAWPLRWPGFNVRADVLALVIERGLHRVFGKTSGQSGVFRARPQRPDYGNRRHLASRLHDARCLRVRCPAPC
jgi:hypothetical protein